MTGTPSGIGTTYLSVAPDVTGGVQWGSCFLICTFRFSFFWPLYCPSISELQLPITPPASSNISCQKLSPIVTIFTKHYLSTTQYFSARLWRYSIIWCLMQLNRHLRQCLPTICVSGAYHQITQGIVLIKSPLNNASCGTVALYGPFFFGGSQGYGFHPIKNLRNCDEEFVAPFNSTFHNKTLCESGVMWITRFVTYLSMAFHIYLLIIIHFQLIIIKNASILTDFTYLVPPSCLCGILALRDDSNSKIRVRFAYMKNLKMLNESSPQLE